MADKYIEIFEENIKNGKSELSYYGFDKKMHEVGENIKDIVTKMWQMMATGVSGATVPNPSWIDNSYTITYTLTNVTTNNPIVRIKAGEPFDAVLTTSNSSKTVTLSAFTMGGTDKSSNATSATGKTTLHLDSVTGNIVITATQSS